MNNKPNKRGNSKKVKQPAVTKVFKEITDLRGKDRRYLRSLAVNQDPILQIGKLGVGDNLIKQIDDALEARELIKIRVLNNSEETSRGVAPEIAAAVNAHLIQVIGHNIVLFRRSKEKPQIELP